MLPALPFDSLITLLSAVPDSESALRQKYEGRLALAKARRNLVEEQTILEELLRDLAGVLRTRDEEWLGVAEAQEHSGYSLKQLVRLSRDGTVISKGEHRNRRFLRGSLPVKRAASAAKPVRPLAPPSSAIYDPRADAQRVARQLASEKKRGIA